MNVNLYDQVLDNIEICDQTYKPTADDFVNHFGPQIKSTGESLIWAALADGKIDMTYAIVGHAMPDDKVIIDYDVFVNLLINYGFEINSIILFIDRYVNLTTGKDGYPVFMINKMSKAIYDNVVPLLDLNKSKNKKTKKKNNKRKK